MVEEEKNDQPLEGEAPAEPEDAASAAEAEQAAEESAVEEPAGEEPPAEEAAAEEPAAEEAPPLDEAAQPQPEPSLSPKERRRRERSTSTGEARPQRSPEERARERAEARREKAEHRRRWRQRARERRKAAPKTEPPAPVERARGKPRMRQGVVVSDKGDKTIAVRIDVARQHRTYGKIVRTSSTLHAHDERNEAHEGDTVRVVESRPLSRTKRWRLVEVLERAR